jgi:hypothetical protein
MQPNLPRFVELQFSLFNDQAINLLVIARSAAGLEVWVHPDWAQRLDAEDRAYLSDLMEEWKSAPPDEIPTILDELSRQSHGPLRVSNSGTLHPDECQALIDRLLAPKR